MKTYEFRGDRLDLRGVVLRRGDQIELEDHDAQYLVIDQGLPFAELAAAATEEKENEVKEDVTV